MHHHVVEVGVATNVELLVKLHFGAAVKGEFLEHLAHHARANLAAHVITYYGQAGSDKLLFPLWVAGNKYGDTVQERHAGVYGTLGVELGCFL